MTDNNLAKAVQLAPIVERVHGSNHPELTRVRELTEALHAAATDTETAALFSEMRSVTDNYTLPGDACEAFEEVYRVLKAADAAR